MRNALINRFVYISRARRLYKNVNNSTFFYFQLPDHKTDTGPQLICRECLKECQNWLLFKIICRENEKLYSPEAPELEPSDSVDGGMSMVLKVEEGDDLLDLWVKGMKYARVCHNDKGGLDPDTVPGHSIDKTTQTKDNLQEDNPMDTSVPRPPIPISQESIELRLSILMGIPLEAGAEEENNQHEALNESLTDILNHSVENNENVLANTVDSHQNIFNNAIKIQDSVSGPCYNLGQEETEERIVLPHTKNVFPTNDGKIIKRISIGKEFPCEEFKQQGITLKDVNRFKDYLELVEESVSQMLSKSLK